jgi:transaldolase
VPKTTIQQLGEFGQSVWLDYISRSLIDTGRLKDLITQGLRGMTSNPTIFDKAISSSVDYDSTIQALNKTKKTSFEIYDNLTIKDIQDATDKFKSVYKQTNGVDGFVSLEVNPKFAYKAEETVAEAKRLYKKVNRPNVMFKVPSTNEGFTAIEQLLAEGINVNITLIFSLQQYKNTAQAYMRGIEKLLQKNGDISKVCSVASVFVSRIDTVIDELIEKKLTREGDAAMISRLKSLRGKAAVANSAIIYKDYVATFFGNAFKILREKGAKVQRLLWGSTSTKNPSYSDIKYVTELIGKHTVNTIPEKTLNAFLDHGAVKEALTNDTGDAQMVIDELMNLGISIDDVCNKLLEDGVVAFERSFDALLKSIEEKSKKL